MKNEKLKVKDLVTIGIFGVIYSIVMFGVGMLGMIPILFLIYPTILGIVSGVIVMLFMAKEQKPWALFIFGMLTPLGMFVMGHTYVVPVHALVVMLIAECIRRGGNYRSIKYNAIAFGIFNMWICGSLMQMLLVKEKYMEMCAMMGSDYVQALEKLITYPHMAIVYVGAFMGGIVGAWIGRAMLKKHFIKAGIA